MNDKIMKTTIISQGHIKKINLLDNPQFAAIVKFGGEIIIPEDRLDIYNFLKDMQKVNPKIKITRSKTILTDATMNNFKKTEIGKL